MSKIIILPSSNQTNKECDGYIIGIKGLSVNLPIYFELDEAISFIKQVKDNHQEIFVSLNKNMHNNDLPFLEELLVKLNDLKINGILYYDLSIFNISRRLKIENELVWAQEHLTTNYLTCNFWYDRGVNYVYLASEITTDEILEISDNTKMKLMVPIFGYLPMFVSKRNLVKNYLETFELEDNSKINYITKKDQEYPIIDNELGTTVYSSHILNGIQEVLKMKDIDYLVLNSLKIKDSDFNEVIKMFKNVNENNVLEYDNKINTMFKTNHGFLYKETIYKVKNNE
ncbi:MAG: U32 family peptidase [Bacilli bacterium]|nr:U32 family peptidase [Bacilli bacterium]MDD4808742.1 U32 family peptidase [Bacilli bacterium]